MNINETHIDLFEGYTSGSMSENEKSQFEQRLKEDVGFKKEFEVYRKLETDLGNHFRDQAKRKLQALDVEMDRAKPLGSKGKSKLIRMTAWSVSIAAALILGVFVFQDHQTLSPQEFASQNWPYEEGLPVKMGREDDYRDAMNAFKQERWEEAIELLEPIESDTAQYFLGCSYFEMEDFKSSLDEFIKVGKASVFYDKARIRLLWVFGALNDQRGFCHLYRAMKEKRKIDTDLMEKLAVFNLSCD